VGIRGGAGPIRENRRAKIKHRFGEGENPRKNRARGHGWHGTNAIRKGKKRGEEGGAGKEKVGGPGDQAGCGHPLDSGTKGEGKCGEKEKRKKGGPDLMCSSSIQTPERTGKNTARDSTSKCHGGQTQAKKKKTTKGGNNLRYAG